MSHFELLLCTLPAQPHAYNRATALTSRLASALHNASLLIVKMILLFTAILGGLLTLVPTASAIKNGVGQLPGELLLCLCIAKSPLPMLSMLVLGYNSRSQSFVPLALLTVHRPP